MILTDKNILNELNANRLSIEPFPSKSQIQPSSIDLRLSDEFLLPLQEIVDIKHKSPRYEPIKCNVLQLPARSFVLASTIEKIKLPANLIARVEGRSSLGRLGIAIHITAGYIDPAFEGQITLEIANLSNNTVILYENMRICQIIFEELKETPTKVYGECGNKYQGQTGVTGSLIYYDEDTNKFGEQQ